MSEIFPNQYCQQLVRKHRPDIFFASLYVPADCRSALHALVALDIELSHVRHAVKEELIAHIRYAWWEDALQKTLAGKPPAGHMVLEAWAEIRNELMLQDGVTALFHTHRSHYPDAPADSASPLPDMMQAIIQAHGKKSEKGWHKASELIAGHRKKYGDRRSGWLALKLLAGGLV